MATGYLAIVLHAHLPFVRHPEHERSLEERWLFEALIECYLPLLDVFDRLTEDEVPFALTMSLTPPLLAMLRDDFLRERFHKHLGRLQALAENEKERLWGDRNFAPVACFYADELARVRSIWERARGDVPTALWRHHQAGRVDLLTSSATHCYLPGLLPAREGIFPQLELGARAYEQAFGQRPRGVWLPECGYHPDFDADLARAGFRYTVVDTHGMDLARPRPRHGVHAPLVSPSGVAFFGRDPESSRQVWSREEGYPGDPAYRDFYRDIGFDLPESDLFGEVGPNGARLMTGLKYFRITGKTDDKAPYQPGVARERAWVHAGNFVFNRVEQVRHLSGMVPAPVIVSPYDAELFGHWWFEGPQFLEALFRQLPRSNGDVRAVTLRGYLEEQSVVARATPAPSSWGEGGFSDVWVGSQAAWTWRHVHHATRYVSFLVRKYRGAENLRGQALDQMVRELLLLQSSDWAFIMKTGTSVRYAEARFRAHVRRLRHLGYLVEESAISPHDEAWLMSLCASDNFLGAWSPERLRSAFD